MTILYWAAAAVAFVCWIMVLIQMFKDEKILLGILSIFCGIVAFIWGWMNVAKVGQKLMLIWTIAVVISVALGSTVMSSFR
ncbi:hypothetical protein Rhal01_01679 [Rubritalea halochordaticola]|uniref:Uncharacterized protein n=1 Tax=Rubritalea halochordaticola TaxID=714537 RepID=A0ABP9V0Q3_9BACT